MLFKADENLPVLGTEPLEGHLWIVDEQAIRIRG